MHKKGDETLLKRKKKREEIKQKNKLEKPKMNNINNINPYNNYFHGMYLPTPPLQINNQNPAYYNEYQNIYYLNPQPYQIPPGMMPSYLPPQFMMPPKSLEESINDIYERGIVNNIIGAFFIKEHREKLKNNEKRKVPVSTVQLNNENDNNADNNNENANNEDEKVNEDIKEEKEEKKEEEQNNEHIKDENEHNNDEHKDDNELKRPNIG